jgi:hypothetical protein
VKCCETETWSLGPIKTSNGLLLYAETNIPVPETSQFLTSWISTVQGSVKSVWEVIRQFRFLIQREWCKQETVFRKWNEHGRLGNMCVCVCVCVCVHAEISTTTVTKFWPPTEHIISLKTNRFSVATTENTVKICQFRFPERVLLFSSAPRPGYFCGPSLGAADIPCRTKKNCGQHLENSEARRKQLCSNGLNFHLTVSSHAYT